MRCSAAPNRHALSPEATHLKTLRLHKIAGVDRLQIRQAVHWVRSTTPTVMARVSLIECPPLVSGTARLQRLPVVEDARC